MKPSQVDIGTYSLSQGGIITGYVVCKVVNAVVNEHWYLRKSTVTDPWVRPSSVNNDVTVRFQRTGAATTTPPVAIAGTINDYDYEHYKRQ